MMNVTVAFSVSEFLRVHEACKEGAEFALGFPSAAEAWDACTRPEWMLWTLAKLDGYDDTMRALARKWALAVFEKHYSREDEKVFVVFRWLETGDESLRSAAYSAAWSAAWSAARSAAESAAYSAAESAAESAAYSAAESAARSVQCDDIRAACGNPFRD